MRVRARETEKVSGTCRTTARVTEQDTQPFRGKERENARTKDSAMGTERDVEQVGEGASERVCK